MVIDIVEVLIDKEPVNIEDILSLTFNDEAGVESDKISMKVVPNFKRPAPNSKLEVIFKRFDKNNKLLKEFNCGLFHTQTTTRTNNKALSFEATGIEFNENQKLILSHHYKDTKLSNIVDLVAKRLNHKVKFDTTDLLIKSLNQTNETDLNFLNRLATDYNVTFSIKNDIIYFINKDNDNLPKTTVDIDLCQSSNIKHSTKTYYKSCEVSWHDIDKAKTITLNILSGTPVLKIKGTYKTKTEAQLKGKTKLIQENKGIVTGSFSNRGFSIYAGTKINIINTYKNEDDGLFSVKSCNHTFTRKGGWNVDVDIEN
jgi:hypothetical protein